MSRLPVESISVPPAVERALTRASDRNGVAFDYLLQTAMRESSLDPGAKARTSSATGLFQFIESTWLEVLKEEGPRLGYEKLADKISSDPNGNYWIADPVDRTQILGLRKDPDMAADMGAAFTLRNGQYLEQKFGRPPSPGELYIAHFLGANGAGRFFDAGLKTPDAAAADLFPAAAAANKSIFFNSGEPASIREVYQALVARHRQLAEGATATAAVANAAPANTRSVNAGAVVGPAAFAAQQLAEQMNAGALQSPDPLTAVSFASGIAASPGAIATPAGPPLALGPALDSALDSAFGAKPDSNPSGRPSDAEFERFFQRTRPDQ